MLKLSIKLLEIISVSYNTPVHLMQGQLHAFEKLESLKCADKNWAMKSILIFDKSKENLDRTSQDPTSSASQFIGTISENMLFKQQFR